MKTRTQYQCEICDRWYDTREDAEACENRGLAKAYPVGMLYGNHTPGEIYADITLAVADSRPTGHNNYVSAWACRSGGFGDSLGKEQCSSGFFTGLNEWSAKLNRFHPTFVRMVAYLRSQGITPTIWNGKEAVPLDPEPNPQEAAS